MLATGGAAIVVGVLAVGAAVVFGVWYAPAQRAATLGALSRELAARTDQRQMGLERWVADGFEDTRTVAEFPTVRALVAAASAGVRVTRSDLAHVQELLRLFASAQQLERLVLVDARDRVVAAYGSAVLVEGERRLLRELAGTGLPGAGFHRELPGGTPAVGFVAPVRNARGRQVGAVLVEADPADWVYPFLLVSPPLLEPSSEAVLVEQRGDSVVWVSPRRNSTAPPLAERRLLADVPGLPLTDALGRGSRFGSYRDYLGVPVFASTRRIRGAPWGLVVKVDQAEVFGPLGRRLRREAAGWAVALSALWLLAAVMWWMSRRVVALEMARGQARIAAAFNEANDAILIVSPDGRIAESNRQAEQFYGVEPGALRGRAVAELRAEPERAESGQLLRAVRERGAQVWEAHHLAAGGAVVPVEVSSRLVALEGREEIISVVRDIRERKAAEARMLRLNRMLRTLTEINEMMVRGTEPAQVLEGACRIIVEQGGFPLAWIGAPLPGGAVHPIASAGRTAYLAGIAVRWDETPEGAGPTGTALREHRTTVVQDHAAAPESFRPWREAALRHGFRASAAVPIPSAQGVAAALSIYADEPGAFDAELLRLIEQMAGDLGFALRAIEERSARRTAEQRLAEADQRLLAVVAAAPVPIVAVRPDGIVTLWNPAAEREFGWSATEAVGRFNPAIQPDRADRFREILARAVAGEAVSPHEARPRRRDGREFDALVSLALLPGDTGASAEVLSLTVDVTPLREAEAALRANEAKLQAFFRSDVVGTLYGDVYGNILAANDEFLRIVGYDPRDPGASRLRWTELTPPEFLPLDEAAVREAQVRGACTPYEKQYVRKDGSRVWALVGFVLTGERREESVAFVLDISARKAAETSLRRSEQRYRALFDGMVEGYAHCRMVYDDAGRAVDFRYLTVNPAFERLTALRGVEGRLVTEVIPGIRDTNPELFDTYGRVAAGGPPEHFETYVPEMDIWFWISVYGPAPGEFVAIFENVTERARTQAALRESEARFRSLYENTSIGLYRTTPAGRIELANPALVRMLGFASFTELAGRDLEREGYEPSYSRAEFRERLEATGEVRGWESAWERRDGSTIHVRESARAIRGAGGTVAYYEGTVEDITERREAEALAGTLNTRLEDLIRAVQALAAARSLADVGPVVCSHARRLAGADGATFVIRDGEECLYVDDDAIGPLWKGRRFPLDACISGWAMLHRQPAVVPDIYADPRVPVAAYRPSFVKSLAMVPIRTEDPLGAIGIYWAQTHRADELEVRLVQTLADAAARAIENVRLLEELEERVRRRTQELADANREMEAFAYSVSHDLRAPLRAIDGFGRMLEEDHGGRLDDEGRRLLGVVRSSTRGMGQLIDDLLAFSRAGRGELTRARVDMTRLASDVWVSLASPAELAAVGFRIEPLPEAEADPGLTRQVWVNLLSNALKFTRGRPAPSVEVGSRVEAGRAVYFVRDNGVGFDARYRDKLFGVFQRLHSSTEFEGTGVGLALVLRIVTRHGGAVWADGAVGEGATFHFTLPGKEDS